MSQLTRHWEDWQLFVRECYARHMLTVHKVGTDEEWADMMTKAIPKEARLRATSAHGGASLQASVTGCLTLSLRMETGVETEDDVVCRSLSCRWVRARRARLLWRRPGCGRGS